MSYPEIDCPLKEVLELMQLSADELTCREVLDTVVEQVSKAAVSISFIDTGQSSCTRWHQERRLRISSTKPHLIRTKRDDKRLQNAAQQLPKSSSYKSAAMCYVVFFTSHYRNRKNNFGLG